MTHGMEVGPAVLGVDPDTPRLLLPLAIVLMRINQIMVMIGMWALLTASAVLTYSVAVSYTHLTLPTKRIV